MGKAIILLLLVSGSVFGQLNRVEKKIVRTADDQAEEAVTLLRKVVNINSGTMNFEGVKQVGEVFMKEFEALGFRVRWEPGDAFDRAGHLVAVHEGKKDAPRLLLIGHLDTVFEPDHPNQEYTMVNDSTMKGPGVVDMKGGDVIILYALKALKEAGVLDDLTVEVVMTGDEEKSGSPISASKKSIREAAGRADYALGFENGDSRFETAVISRRSSSGWTLQVKGRPAHSSQIFSDEVGAGAIYELSRILTAFYSELRNEEFLTFNPGVILGGTSLAEDPVNIGGTVTGKNNIVAETAVAHGDIRAVSVAQLERARQIMQRIASQNLPHTSATLSFNEGGYPPMDRTDANRELLAIYSQASQDLGFGEVTAVEPINAGAADISFAADRVKGAIDGLGLSGGKDHTPDEFGYLSRLDDLVKRAALLMYRLSGK